MTTKELVERITLARTPTIATEDALTVAALHDKIIHYVNCLNRDYHEARQALMDLVQIARLEVPT